MCSPPLGQHTPWGTLGGVARRALIGLAVSQVLGVADDSYPPDLGMSLKMSQGSRHSDPGHGYLPRLVGKVLLQSLEPGMAFYILGFPHNVINSV